MPSTASRPKFLNVFVIRMPVGAVASFAHRVAGVLLFLCLPLAAFLLDLSLQGPDGFERVAQLLQTPWLRALQAAVAWSLLHHYLAGLRFMAIDIGWGGSRAAARSSALAVNLAAPALTLILLWRLW